MSTVRSSEQNNWKLMPVKDWKLMPVKDPHYYKILHNWKLTPVKDPHYYS